MQIHAALILQVFIIFSRLYCYSQCKAILAHHMVAIEMSIDLQLEKVDLLISPHNTQPNLFVLPPPSLIRRELQMMTEPDIHTESDVGRLGAELKTSW